MKVKNRAFLKPLKRKDDTMPYEIGRYTGDKLKVRALQRPPLGPGFSSEAVEKAAELVIIGSSFKDPGDDWTDFKLVDSSGNIIESRMLSGF